MSCLFCQNYSISRGGVGREIDPEGLAEGMINLQRRGVHLINLVTASHVTPQAVMAVRLAREHGLSIPVAWNSNGYEKPETIALLSGIIDIFLPDMKYDDDRIAQELSAVPDYTSWNRRAVVAMFSLAGHLDVDGLGLARRGVMIRHLVLPGDLSQTSRILAFIAANFGPETYLSLMFQYFPAHRAVGRDILGRRLTAAECRRALSALRRSGIRNGWRQDMPMAEKTESQRSIR